MKWFKKRVRQVNTQRPGENLPEPLGNNEILESMEDRLEKMNSAYKARREGDANANQKLVYRQLRVASMIIDDGEFHARELKADEWGKFVEERPTGLTDPDWNIVRTLNMRLMDEQKKTQYTIAADNLDKYLKNRPKE